MFYDLGCDKDGFFPDCTQDPFAGSVSDPLWPLLEDVPSTTAPNLLCEAKLPRASATCSSQDESAQVGLRRTCFLLAVSWAEQTGAGLQRCFLLHALRLKYILESQDVVGGLRSEAGN